MSRLAELNPYVPVKAITGPITEAVLRHYTVVVATQAPLSEQLKIDDFCHANGIYFIAAEARGVFGSVFNDFGKRFVVLDTNGEQPATCLIAGVTKDKEGMVTCLEESRHNLEDGDYVTFTEIQGMTELNDSEPRKVKVLSPLTFSIGDTSSFSNYRTGGRMVQVKMPKTIDFVRAGVGGQE